MRAVAPASPQAHQSHSHSHTPPCNSPQVLKTLRLKAFAVHKRTSGGIVARHIKAVNDLAKTFSGRAPASPGVGVAKTVNASALASAPFGVLVVATDALNSLAHNGQLPSPLALIDAQQQQACEFEDWQAKARESAARQRWRVAPEWQVLASPPR